jgi:hypothetical protein
VASADGPSLSVRCARPRPEHEGREDREDREGVREEAEPDVRVEGGSSVAPYEGLTSGPWAEATKRSVKFAFGKDPVFVREGGTIGAVLSMGQILKRPIVFMGVSLPDHVYHAPNENYDLGPGRRRHGRLREVLRGGRGGQVLNLASLP